MRGDVLAGGYWLRDPVAGGDRVVIATCGALVPEALAAAETLHADEGVEAGVFVCSSPDRLYRDWRGARLAALHEVASVPASSHLDRLFAGLRGVPLVTLIDGASHALAFLGACLGSRTVPLGVDAFGQTGSQPELYEAFDVAPAAIATAALVALEP